MEPIKTKNSETWVDEDILRIKMFGEITVEEVVEITKVGTELFEKFKDLKYIMSESEVKKMSLEARKAAFENFKEVRAKKLAMISKNPITRVITAFFLKRYKYPVPTKMFGSVEDAKKWFNKGE